SGSLAVKRVLYVTTSTAANGIGGRQQLSRLNSELLSDICGEGYTLIELEDGAGFGRLIGYIDGVTPTSIRKICQRIQASKSSHVFLDGSNLGKLAAGI